MKLFWKCLQWFHLWKLIVFFFQKNKRKSAETCTDFKSRYYTVLLRAIDTVKNFAKISYSKLSKIIKKKKKAKELVGEQTTISLVEQLEFCKRRFFLPVLYNSATASILIFIVQGCNRARISKSISSTTIKECVRLEKLKQGLYIYLFNLL